VLKAQHRSGHANSKARRGADTKTGVHKKPVKKEKENGKKIICQATNEKLSAIYVAHIISIKSTF
jgi:creatinine amidohydrolase/Fe(II)-dependent formamide hydrolase-like protein